MSLFRQHSAQGQRSASLTRYNYLAKTVTLSALLAVGVAQCGIKRSTSIIVAIDTNLVAGSWTEATITGIGLNASDTQSETFGAVNFQPTSRRTGMVTLPATVVFTAQEAPTQTLSLTIAVKSGATVVLTTVARATFSQGMWRQINITLAAQCLDQATSVRCTVAAATTCGSTDPASPCVSITRDTQLYEPDASVSSTADR